MQKKKHSLSCSYIFLRRRAFWCKKNISRKKWIQVPSFERHNGNLSADNSSADNSSADNLPYTNLSADNSPADNSPANNLPPG
jgi:hypothetical protein